MKKLWMIAFVATVLTACGSPAPEIDETEEKQRDSIDKTQKSKDEMILDSIMKAEELKESLEDSSATN
jgi:uncharacterized lipoprotein YmbA